jgi:hypothetical protein
MIGGDRCGLGIADVPQVDVRPLAAIVRAGRERERGTVRGVGGRRVEDLQVAGDLDNRGRRRRRGR